MTRVRLGSVTYLNARPCVVGLDDDDRFDLRFDLPSRCAALLHDGSIDVGLVPSIEYLRGVDGPDTYRIVPDVAIASDGAVASVALYTKRPIADVRSIALDTSSRTSVALTRVLCAKVWNIDPTFESKGPELEGMLDRCDAALLIGDAALFVDHERVGLKPDTTPDDRGRVRLRPDDVSDEHSNPRRTDAEERVADAQVALAAARPLPDVASSIEKIDLGTTWRSATGLPFVYAFWAGRVSGLSAAEVRAIQAARDAGIADLDRVAAAYLDDPLERVIGARYLRDNIKYYLGERERAGLETFYRFASEVGLVPGFDRLRFY